MKRRGQVTKEEIIDGILYYAIDVDRDLNFGDAAAHVNEVQRYKTKVPPGEAGVEAHFAARVRWIETIGKCKAEVVLRVMLLFVLIGAVVCSWFAVKMDEAKRQREVVEAVRMLGGDARYYYGFDRNGQPLPRISVPLGLKWLWDQLGVDFFADVQCVSFARATDAELLHLKRLTCVRELWLGSTQVTDDGLLYIEGLTNLRALDLEGTRVSDAGLVHLKGMTHLEMLRLSHVRSSWFSVAFNHALRASSMSRRSIRDKFVLSGIAKTGAVGAFVTMWAFSSAARSGWMYGLARFLFFVDPALQVM